jgi:ComF family protein
MAGALQIVAGAMLREALNGAVRVFLAPACVGCDGLLREPLNGPVCAPCWRAVAFVSSPWCARCGDELSLATEPALCARCLAAAPAFSIARSAGRYDGALRRIIHAFKYEHRRALAPALARLMADAGADVLDDADALVPVPLHPLRSLTRGFNQADDLARHLGLPVWRLLRRTTLGRPQAALSAERRRTNVARAFSARPRLPVATNAWRWRRVRGRTVVVVDDVMTTGATLDACSRVLLDLGAREVRALTAARAVAAPPGSPPAPRRPATVRHR